MKANTREAAALGWLSNPVIIWGGAVLLLLLAVRYLLPGLLGGIWDKAKTGVGGAIDSLSESVASILGASSLSQLPDRQLTVAQQVGALAAGGEDRAWSDLLDKVGLQ